MVVALRSAYYIAAPAADEGDHDQRQQRGSCGCIDGRQAELPPTCEWRGSGWRVPDLSNARTPVTEGEVDATLRCGGGVHVLCGLGRVRGSCCPGWKPAGPGSRPRAGVGCAQAVQ